MKVYRVMAYLVAAAVAFQAATIAYALFALGSWVQKGGVLDKAAMDGSGGVGGEGGLAAHGYGAIAVAVLGLALLVTSFFVRFPGGIRWAAIVFGLVVLQWVLAFLSFDAAAVGVLHGLNALAVLGTAMAAAAHASRAGRGRRDVVVEEPATVAG